MANPHNPKNSALPVMAASLLTAEPLRVHNIPKVRDLITMSKLLTFMHVNVAIKEFPASDYVLQATKLNDEVAPYELVKTMRASILTLGPLIALVPYAEKARGWLADALTTFGRVPLFYYLLHIPLIHLVAVLISVTIPAPFLGLLGLIPIAIGIKNSQTLAQPGERGKLPTRSQHRGTS